MQKGVTHLDVDFWTIAAMNDYPALRNVLFTLLGFGIIAVVIGIRACQTREPPPPPAPVAAPAPLPDLMPSQEVIDDAMRTMIENVKKAAAEEERREKRARERKKTRLMPGTHYDPDHPRIPGLEYRGTRD